ncbi:hypothetical protein [Kribbella sp.]|uniref:hypothetical protein n=1 Tax=Kribbella sp. TaxID=1871183 RepID=UPI002D5AEC41|nr:hypothetical protein [Kribbella sp.]HZX04653.1 hypothetical protein [Kribbella sp.]
MAARSAAKLLRRMGLRLLGTESLFVNETTGPIRDVELDRAHRWGEDLGRLHEHELEL